jgi:glycerophosphoryl diester phosphodiesterase
MLIWAHRGSHRVGGPLENTLPAFERAVTEAADGIELDVHLSRDGIPVVFHDETLDRLVLGRDGRRVDSMSAAELGQVTLLQGHSIPTLSTVLEVLAGRLPLNIEIKDAAAVDAVADLLAVDEHNDCLISSFSASAIQHAARRLPNHPRAWISGEPRTDAALAERLKTPFDTLASCKAHRWHTDAMAVTSENVAHAGSLGISVHVWTINSADDVRRLEALGVSGIFTDHPGELRRALAEENM